MKKYLYILILLILFITYCNKVIGQVLLNNDKKTAKITNNGTFRVLSSGVLNGMPDTIAGRVEFISNNPAHQQVIPNVTYNLLLIKGFTTKYADSTWLDRGKNPLVTLDSLIIEDHAIFVVDTVEVDAKAAVKNTALTNGRRDVRMNGDTARQTIEGNGRFSNVNIDNTYGVDVVNGGGFTIQNKLELTRGKLRNDSANNFRLADSIRIIRHTTGSIAAEPIFEGKNPTVKYVGTGAMTAGPELPVDTTTLKNFYIENTGITTLSKNVTVNDSLLISTRVNTEPDSANQYVLTHASFQNPIYTNKDAEVDGSVRRTNLRFDSTLNVFNNPHTYAQISSLNDADHIREITFRVKPATFSPFLNGTMKVKRSLFISALDSNYNPKTTGVSVRVGYGWRYSSDAAKDEENTLPLERLILQRWTDRDWFDIVNSNVPTLDTANEWAFSSARPDMFGHFVIGLTGKGMIASLNSRVFLEGPFRYGSMQMDLRVKNLIPTTPPDIYPYNLDPKRAFISVASIPDSVVDWIVIEFRPTLTSMDRFYRTVFLRCDGRIVDLDGKSPVFLSKAGIDSGEYFVALRHRNHLAIISENRLSLFPETAQNLIDFSSPSNVMGRTNSLKPIGFDSKGLLVFGMVAGDVNQDGLVNDVDLLRDWNDRDFINGYFGSDLKMNGIVTTRDFNVVWNNRGRLTSVP